MTVSQRILLSVFVVSGILMPFECVAADGDISGGVNLYLLQDSKMDFETARKRPLSELALREEPWIASREIKRYDVSTHCIYLNKKVSVACEQVMLRGTPFVMVANGERCYLGALWTYVSSFLPMGNVPIIYEPGRSLIGGQPDLIDISLLSVLRKGEPVVDVRGAPRILEALRAQGQYSAGLRCTLDKVEVLKENGTSSVRYTFTIRNMDADDLYVLDPERINTDFFHDFQNGVRGRRTGNDEVSFAWPNPRDNGGESTPWGKVDLAWFALLKSGQSMTRTVVMKGLPKISPGKYECQLSYGSPEYLHGVTGTVTKAQRRQKNGKVWLGQIEATLVIDVLIQ
jgi:hypothetical protein